VPVELHVGFAALSSVNCGPSIVCTVQCVVYLSPLQGFRSLNSDCRGM